jgi:hypothetical protein
MRDHRILGPGTRVRVALPYLEPVPKAANFKTHSAF